MNNLYEMFDSIAYPFTNGKCLENSKESIIIDLLKDYNAHYENGVGIIVPALTEYPKKVIVSHIDLVYPFQVGFSQGIKFKIENKRLFGALDNTLTNAFLILAIKELREKGLAEDVEFLFTEGEESGLTGMSSYMKKIFPLRNNPFFINLDVTNDNWDYSSSVEYDYPNKNICKQINKYSNNIGFLRERFTDDTSAILSYNGQGFSYCVPTQNYCHTYDSYTMVDKLVPYYNGLLFLIKDLEVNDRTNDINSVNNKNISLI